MKIEQSSTEEELSPTLQEIKDMDLNLSESEFKEAARDDRSTSMETSTDAFLQIAKKLIEGERSGPNTFGAALRILERDSMQGHPKMELFKSAVQELAKKSNEELKLPEGYWDKLK